MSTTLAPDPRPVPVEEDDPTLHARLFLLFEQRFYGENWPRPTWVDGLLRGAGAIVVGAFAAGLSLLLIFVILNMILHYTPSA